MRDLPTGHQITLLTGIQMLLDQAEILLVCVFIINKEGKGWYAEMLWVIVLDFWGLFKA